MGVPGAGAFLGAPSGPRRRRSARRNETGGGTPGKANIHQLMGSPTHLRPPSSEPRPLRTQAWRAWHAFDTPLSRSHRRPCTVGKPLLGGQTIPLRSDAPSSRASGLGSNTPRRSSLRRRSPHEFERQDGAAYLHSQRRRSWPAVGLSYWRRQCSRPLPTGQLYQPS